MADKKEVSVIQSTAGDDSGVVSSEPSANDEKEFDEIVEWLAEDDLSLRCRMLMFIFILHNHDNVFWRVAYPQFRKLILTGAKASGRLDKVLKSMKSREGKAISPEMRKMYFKHSIA
jgi:hypothetical protein